jgi:hypothetical protein
MENVDFVRQGMQQSYVVSIHIHKLRWLHCQI